jgi:hypothetical protein
MESEMKYVNYKKIKVEEETSKIKTTEKPIKMLIRV